MRFPPPVTFRLFSRPSAPISGVPVVKVARGVLMKPQPLQVIPAGLAITTSARPPNTSIGPSSALRFGRVTSLRMTAAGPVPLRLGLPGVTPPSFELPISRSWLLRISPGSPTLKASYLLCDSPALFGATMSISGTPFGAAPMPGRLAAGAEPSGVTACA